MLAVRCMRLYARGYQSERIDREPAAVARQRRPDAHFLASVATGIHRAE